MKRSVRWLCPRFYMRRTALAPPSHTPHLTPFVFRVAQNVKPWPGDFDSYKDHLLEEMRKYEEEMDAKYGKKEEKGKGKGKGKEADKPKKSKFASIGDLKL